MRTSTRWLTVGASALVLVGGALTVAAATEGSREVPGGPGREHQFGEMRGDVDQIHDRDQTRLRDESCLDAVATEDEAVPAGEGVQERTRARERAGEANANGEMNVNAGAGGPQQEREQNGSGPSEGPTQEQTQTQEQGGNMTGASGNAGHGGA